LGAGSSPLSLFYRPRTYIKASCDFFGRFSGGNHLQDFLLPSTYMLLKASILERDRHAGPIVQMICGRRSASEKGADAPRQSLPHSDTGPEFSPVSCGCVLTVSLSCS